MKKYLIALSIFLLLSTAFILIKSIENQDLLEEKVNALNSQNEDKRLMLDLLYGNMKMHYTYAGHQFQDFIVLDKERNKIKFSTIVGDSNKVIYKFSSANCSSCIHSGLTSIQKLIRKIPQNQLIVIADRSNRRELQALSNSLNLDFPIYLVEEDVFDTILEKENVPFLFIIGSDLQMKEFFIPMKELPDYSEMYYQIIWKKYFSK